MSTGLSPNKLIVERRVYIEMLIFEMGIQGIVWRMMMRWALSRYFKWVDAQEGIDEP